MSSNEEIPTKLTLTEFLQRKTDELTNISLIPTMEELRMIRKGLRKRGPLVFSAITDGTQTQHWRGCISVSQ